MKCPTCTDTALVMSDRLSPAIEAVIAVDAVAPRRRVGVIGLLPTPSAGSTLCSLVRSPLHD